VADQIRLQKMGYHQQPPPADIEAKYFAAADQRKADAADMKERIKRLVKAAPYNVTALRLGAVSLDDHLDDPLQALRWKLSLASNAVVHSNGRYDLVGYYAFDLKNEYGSIQFAKQRGEGPSFSQVELDEVLVCPFVRALRLLDEACAGAEFAVDQCYAAAGMFYEDEQSGPDSLMADAKARGVCAKDLTAPLDGLRLTEIDLHL
jgi:hypothetical protein